MALLVEQLHVAVVGAQGVVLREEVRLVHVFDGLRPDAHLVARLAVGIVLFGATAVPGDAVEVVGHGGGEANARQEFWQTALSLRTQMVVDADGAVVIEVVGVVEGEAG